MDRISGNSSRCRVIEAYAALCRKEGVKPLRTSERVLCDASNSRSIDLSKQYIGSRQCVLIAQVIVDTGISLQGLNVSYNGIDGSSMDALATHLSRLPSLVSLNLNGNPLGVVGGTSLLKLAADNPNLCDLSFEDCGVTGSISEAIQHVAELKQKEFRNCNVLQPPKQRSVVPHVHCYEGLEHGTRVLPGINLRSRSIEVGDDEWTSLFKNGAVFCFDDEGCGHRMYQQLVQHIVNREREWRSDEWMAVAPLTRSITPPLLAGKSPSVEPLCSPTTASLYPKLEKAEALGMEITQQGKRTTSERATVAKRYEDWSRRAREVTVARQEGGTGCPASLFVDLRVAMDLLNLPEPMLQRWVVCRGNDDAGVYLLRLWRCNTAQWVVVISERRESSGKMASTEPWEALLERALAAMLAEGEEDSWQRAMTTCDALEALGGGVCFTLALDQASTRAVFCEMLQTNEERRIGARCGASTVLERKGAEAMGLECDRGYSVTGIRRDGSSFLIQLVPPEGVRSMWRGAYSPSPATASNGALGYGTFVPLGQFWMPLEDFVAYFHKVYVWSRPCLLELPNPPLLFDVAPCASVSTKESYLATSIGLECTADRTELTFTLSPTAGAATEARLVIFSRETYCAVREYDVCALPVIADLCASQKRVGLMMVAHRNVVMQLQCAVAGGCGGILSILSSEPVRTNVLEPAAYTDVLELDGAPRTELWLRGVAQERVTIWMLLEPYSARGSLCFSSTECVGAVSTTGTRTRTLLLQAGSHKIYVITDATTENVRKVILMTFSQSPHKMEREGET